MDLSSPRRISDAASEVSLLRPEELFRLSPILLPADNNHIMTLVMHGIKCYKCKKRSL